MELTETVGVGVGVGVGVVGVGGGGQGQAGGPALGRGCDGDSGGGGALEVRGAGGTHTAAPQHAGVKRESTENKIEAAEEDREVKVRRGEARRGEAGEVEQ